MTNDSQPSDQPSATRRQFLGGAGATVASIFTIDDDGDGEYIDDLFGLDDETTSTPGITIKAADGTTVLDAGVLELGDGLTWTEKDDGTIRVDVPASARAPELTNQALQSPWPTGDVWKKSDANPILSPGSAGWEDQSVDKVLGVIPPSRSPLGKYEVYYRGIGSSDNGIGRATGDSLTSLSRDDTNNPLIRASNLGSWAANDFGNGGVVRVGGTTYLVASGRDGSSVYTIGAWTASDGVSFSATASNPVFTTGASGAFDESKVWQPVLVFTGTHFVMPYRGTDANGVNQAGIAFTRDLVSFQRYSGNPVLTNAASGWDTDITGPAGELVGSTAIMPYSGSNPEDIGFAYAHGGFEATFLKDPANPTVTSSSSGFDSSEVEAANTLTEPEKGRAALFYAGNNGSYEQIGLATASL